MFLLYTAVLHCRKCWRNFKANSEKNGWLDVNQSIKDLIEIPCYSVGTSINRSGKFSWFYCRILQEVSRWFRPVVEGENRVHALYILEANWRSQQWKRRALPPTPCLSHQIESSLLLIVTIVQDQIPNILLPIIGYLWARRGKLRENLHSYLKPVTYSLQSHFALSLTDHDPPDIDVLIAITFQPLFVMSSWPGRRMRPAPAFACKQRKKETLMIGLI